MKWLIKIMVLLLVRLNGEITGMTGSHPAGCTNADELTRMDSNGTTPVTVMIGKHTQELDAADASTSSDQSKPGAFSGNCSVMFSNNCSITSNITIYRDTPETQESEKGQQPTEIVSKESLSTVRFITDICLLPIIAVPGCVFNIFNIYIMTRKTMQNSTNYYLIALSIADLWYLLMAILRWNFFMIEHFNQQLYVQIKISMHAPIIEDWLVLAAGRTSNVFILFLSIERFVAVKFPLTARMSYLSRHPVKIIAGIFITITTVLIPNLLRGEYAVSVQDSTNTTGLIYQNTEYYHSNPEFFRIYVYCLLVTLRFVPVVFVFLLNICIIVILKRSRKSMASLQASNSDVRDRQQFKVTRMLIIVSAIFLICVSPGLVHSFIANFLPGYTEGSRYGNLWSIFFAIYPLLDTVNSTVNFFVYVLMSKQFRDLCFGACGKITKMSRTTEQDVI